MKRKSNVWMMAGIFLLGLSLVSMAGLVEAKPLPRNSVGPAQLKKNAVTTVKIRNNAVATSKIRNNAVTTSKIRNGAVTAVKLAAPAGLATNPTAGNVNITNVSKVVRSLTFVAPSNGMVQVTVSGNEFCAGTGNASLETIIKVVRSDGSFNMQGGRSNIIPANTWVRYSQNHVTNVLQGTTKVELWARCIVGTGKIYTDHLSALFVPVKY